MNQKLADWASIAEILSGIAVVITLIVLVVGVRENTEVVRASMFDSIVDKMNSFQATVATDPDLLRIWTAYVEGSATDLDEIDTQRLNLILLTQFRNFESAFFSRRYGVVGEEEWGRLDRSICDWDRRANLAQKRMLLERVMTPQFLDYLASRCTQ